LKDALATRHVFPSNTILSPYQYLVVFGGGSPDLPDVYWQKASTGGLSLNNTSEILALFDASAVLIQQVSYGALGNQNQSIARFSEGTGTQFVLHSSLAQNQLYSPGESLEGKAMLFDQAHSVPEPSSALLFALGLVTPLISRFKNR
jgi:hypothetical protein